MPRNQMECDNRPRHSGGRTFDDKRGVVLGSRLRLACTRVVSLALGQIAHPGRRVRGRVAPLLFDRNDGSGRCRDAVRAPQGDANEQDKRVLERTPRRMLQACRSGDPACVIGGQRSEPRIVRFCIIRRCCGGCGNGCILGGADARRSLCHPGATGMQHLRVYKEVSPSRDSIET